MAQSGMAPLGPFRLERLLGRGGTSEVWAAVHTRQRVPVAIKVQRLAGHALGEAAAAEVRAVARLDHRNVILVYDQGVLEVDGAFPAGTWWLAMERCSGGSLRDRPPADWPALCAALAEVLAGLAAAHARGVLHRDLKPDNVLLATPGDLWPGLKLTDFGLTYAREVDTPNVVLGTPAYMAPEQFARAWRDYAPATDLYALGCLAWFLATGTPPFGEYRPPEVLAVAHAELDPPAFQPRFPVPPGFEELLRRLLRKDPLARPRDAAQVRAALAVLAEEPERELFPARCGDGEAARPPLRLWGVGLGLYAHRAVPLVGRATERDQLWSALGDVYRGGVANLAVVTGPLGVGKSRLIASVAERAAELGLASVLRVEHPDDDVPALPAALANAIGAAGLAGDALEARLASWLGRRGVNDDWEVRSLHTLLEPTHAKDSDSVAFLTPQQRQVVARRLLERLAAEKPLVLWVEDAWRAGDTLAFVEHLLDAQRESPSPVLVVLAVRGESLAERAAEQAQVEALLARPGAVAVELGPLGADEQVQLVEGLLGLSGELAARVRERCGGNPAFAVQLVGDWVQRGLLVPTGDGFVLRAGAQVDLPDDVHHFWSARVERALDGARVGGGRGGGGRGGGGRVGDPRDPDARSALEIAALLGADVEVAEWSAACACAGVVLPPGLTDHLARERLIVPRGTRWSFAHNMVRESVVRAAVEAGRAPPWHAACAFALAMQRGEPGHHERMANHLAGAGELESAADFQLLAAQERVERGEDRTALALLADRDDGLEAAGVPASDYRWGEGYVLQARIHARQGAFDAAARPADAALEGARRHGWDQLLRAALTVRGEVARGQGDATRALDWLTEARTACEGAGDRAELANVLRSLGTLSAQLGQLARAGRTLVQAQGHFQELGDNRGVAACLVARADVARRAGELDRVPELLALAAPIHQRHGSRAGEADTDQVRADVARVRGDVALAVRLYRSALERYEALGSVRVLGPLAGLGAALERQGLADDARNALDLGLRLAARQGSGEWQGLLHALLLPVAVAANDLDAFDDHLTQARHWLRRTREANPDVADAADRAAAAFGSREPERARQARRLAAEQREVLVRNATG